MNDGVVAADAAAQSASPETVEYRFDFRGSTGEYFKIWSVNVLLSVLTLGIYSAWAKVRNRRYFYTHTFLDGANFDYHARPLSILLSRILVIGILVAANTFLSPEFYGDELGIASLVFLFLFLPWAWVRGLSFNARNSSYRNVRFAFRRKYGASLFAFTVRFCYPVVGWFAMPWLLRGYHGYKCRYHQLGRY